MAKRGGTTGQGRGQRQGQGQAQGRERSKVIRVGLADLEVDWGHEVLPGGCPTPSDLGFDDEADGDLQLDEHGDAEDASPEPTWLPDGAAAEAEPSGLTLADLLGSRPPVVLVRIVVEQDQVRARTQLPAPTAAAAESLAELRALLAYLFQRGRDTFSSEDWDRLIGAAPILPAERLMLLARLAVAGNAAVEIAYHERHSADPVVPWVETWVTSPEIADADADQLCARYRFTPNDRGQERYAKKFAALPDGTPFSIRMLLLDARGRRPANPHPFDLLPMAVKLQALCQILNEEQRLGLAFDYERFRAEFQQALDRLGLIIDRPTWKHIKNLMETLAKSGLGDAFPKKEERQRRYDVARQEAVP
jgi:hypothetical protein